MHGSTQITLLSLTAVFCMLVSTEAIAQNELKPKTDTNSTAENINENRCVDTDGILKYQVESDIAVRLFMRDNQQVMLRVKRFCPQLHFHRYMSYTPIDGRICAGADDIKTRAGLVCRIESLTPLSNPVPHAAATAAKQ